MRAAFVLALIVSVAAPPLASSMAAAASPAGATESAMAPPADALCKLVRESATAEKTFSSGWFAAPENAASLPLLGVFDHDVPPRSPLHAIGFDAPPLAPRPPPHS